MVSPDGAIVVPDGCPGPDGGAIVPDRRPGPDSGAIVPDGCFGIDVASNGGSDGVCGVGILAPGLYSVMP